MSGQGEHCYVRLEKTLLTTPELVRLVAQRARVPEGQIGVAGMKDKHAVTSQWLSLPVRSVPPQEWELPEGVRLLEVGRHDNKLRTGHLRGNHFSIRLVDVEPESAERLDALAARLAQGLFNAFGEQRFGSRGDNLQSALSWLDSRRPLRGGKARFLSKLYPSVIQSELFNRYLSVRRNHDLCRLMAGEYVRLAERSASFRVEDPAAEQPRYQRGELILQGPMFGDKMRPATGEALELEHSVLAELPVSDDDLHWLSAYAPGTRRDLWLVPSEFSLEPLGDGSVRLEVTLPAGAYATELLRELTRQPWLSARGSDRTVSEPHQQ